MPGLKIDLFGAPHLEEGGQTIPLGRSKALGMLAYLCLNRGATAREVLLDLLWPSFGPEEARNNLRRELSLLKGALPAGALIADRQAIGLDPRALQDGRIEVDVLSFEAAVERAAEHHHPGGGLCAQCAAALEAAVALYRHDFLAGFGLPDSSAFDEWQFHQADRLRRELARALHRLSDWRLERGEFERATPLAQRRVGLDVLDESAHRDLMQLYGVVGRHAAAIRHYERLRQTLRDELSIEPEPATVQLYEAIRGRQLILEPSSPVGIAAPAAVVPNNLPADMTPFIGRRDELERLDMALADPNVRLVTIAGPGGMGKTRLAFAWARRYLEHTDGPTLFPDGVFLVPLAPVGTAAQISSAIGRALSLSLHDPDDPLRELVTFLRPRRTLLLIDNLEHLLADGAAGILDEILVAAPGVRMLVTSRAQLRTRGEYLLTLAGLNMAVPGTWAIELRPDTTTDDALALFLDVAHRARPDFTADGPPLLAAARICRYVQGMPLAIELAAGWLALMGVTEIVAEIEHDLDFLVSPWDDVPARQASLRAIFDTSWKLLVPEEQDALKALTVFRGGFDREAACAVADASLRTIAALVAKSWLRPIGGERLQMHELLRQYAAHELGEPPAELDPHRRHAAYFAGLVEAQLAPLRGPSPASAYQLLDRETDNIQTALVWLIEHGALQTIIDRMLPALFRFLESRFHYNQFAILRDVTYARARAADLTRETAILFISDRAYFFNGYPTRFIDYQWIDEALTGGLIMAWNILQSQPDAYDFWDLLLAWEYGRFVNAPAGAEKLRRSISALEGSQHLWELAFAHQCLGRLLARVPEAALYEQEAYRALNTARAVFTQLNDRREAAATLLFLGYQRQAAGHVDEARSLMVLAQSELKAIGDHIFALNINWVLADIHMQMGEVDTALRILLDLAEALISSGHAQLAIDSLSRAAFESTRYRDAGEALRLRERSLSLSRAFGYSNYESWDIWEMGEVYRVMGNLDEARRWFERAMGIFSQFEHHVGRSFYYRGLGDLALAAGEYAEARHNFEISRQEVLATYHPWQLAYVTAGLGRAATGIGDFDAASRHLAEALRIAQANGDNGLITAVLRGVVDFFVAQGREPLADSLAAAILAHPLSWRETRAAVSTLTGRAAGIDSATGKQLIDLTPLINQVLTELDAF